MNSPLTISPIEDGIPIPSRGGCLQHPAIDAILQLAPGQSRLFDGYQGDGRDFQRTLLRGAARHGIRITSRKIHGQGFRVWRVA